MINWRQDDGIFASEGHYLLKKAIKDALRRVKEKEAPKMASTMTMKDLTRVPAEVSLPKPDVADLAAEASKLLGYHVLLKEIHKPLLQLLSKLEIEILDKDKVKTYQAQIVNKLGRNFSDEDEDADDYYWEKASLSGYNQPIPEFVLAKAVEIKKANSSVEFQVEYLEKVADPFLIAVLAHESYYLEVWDEPKFEGRITKVVTKKKKI
jgi:hypothetical protein